MQISKAVQYFVINILFPHSDRYCYVSQCHVLRCHAPQFSALLYAFVMSRSVMSWNFARLYHVLQCHSVQFRPRLSCVAMSCLAIFFVRHFPVLHLQSTRLDDRSTELTVKVAAAVCCLLQSINQSINQNSLSSRTTSRFIIKLTHGDVRLWFPEKPGF